MVSNKTVLIGGFNVTIIRSKRRSLGLEVSPQGIKARAPMRMTESDIIDFVHSKQGWLSKHLQNMPKSTDKASSQLLEGANLRLRGQSYQLKLERGKRGKVRVHGDEIIVPVTRSHLPIDTSVQNKLVRWYKTVAQQELQTRARYYAARMDVAQRRADQVYVRDYKRRWGSCDSKGKLSFNWRLLQAPTDVSDYVVIHELAHCHEFNHSKRFWAIVAKEMPNYQQHDQWLKHHGHELYGF